MIRKGFILLFLLNLGCISGQDLLNRSIQVHVENMLLKDVLDQISGSTDVFFTYAGNIEAMNRRITLNIDKIQLNKLLTDLFYGQNVIFTSYSNQIILKKKPEQVHNINIRGTIQSSETQLPVEFATVQFKRSGKGTVAGIDGKFEITTPDNEADDSISFNCIGFEPRVLSLKFLKSLDYHNIYLTPRVTELEPVEASASKPKSNTEGNRGIPLGSIYLDTHGQQVALYIENPKGLVGRIKSVSYFLSGKGNTEAPFRVRIYGKNENLGCPGTEILPDILLVNPKQGRGWYKVDVTKYNIRFPEMGLFIAMEGIYPEDYHIDQNKTLSGEEDGTTENNDEFMEGSLDYGQRLGYNRFSKNHTWHYSLSSTWFQLSKKNFNVMISIEVLVYKPQKN